MDIVLRKSVRIKQMHKTGQLMNVDMVQAEDDGERSAQSGRQKHV